MNKRFIQHGIWTRFGAYNRRTRKYIQIPLKLREFLQEKALKFDLMETEFTYGIIPEEHVAVITIVHPMDRFCRRVGYKIVQERLDWVEKLCREGNRSDINKKSWAYALTNDGT